MLLPVQMLSGLVYYTYNFWAGTGIPLAPLAWIHTFVALLLLNFLIVHVYMTTTGHSLFSHISGMITGWEEVNETTEIEEWELPEKRKKQGAGKAASVG